MRKPPTTWYWHIRSYEHSAHVRLLLCQQFGATGHAYYLWGMVLPPIAEEIAAVTGLPVERDNVPYADDGKTQPKELTPVAEQGSLFT